MYLISDETRSLLSNNYRQIVKITCNGLENTFELTESNIAQGGLSINRYCVSGDKIEIGSAVASELTLKLDNRDDRFSETVFEGAELQVQLGIKKWDAYRWENAQIQWIPLGYFTVDETPRKLSYITLSALDRMVRFDKEVTENDITFPIKISSLLSVCCANCNVPLKTIPTSLLNADYIVTKFPDYDELTYRRLIQWIAEISGTCAFVDWNGELCLSGYSLDNDFSLTPSDRYSSDMYEQDITITGVQISDDDDNVYLAGTDDYAFNIENNGLIQSNHLEIATAIFNKVKDIVYRPYTCTCKPLPYVYPLDGVSYTDKNGIVHKSIVTGITFKMNASTTLEGKGETQTKNGYASANPLTKAESVVLKKLENRVNRKISNYEQASLDMNEIISNSLGLYRTEVVEENGSTTYYYHDATTLENSAIIYTFNAGGFAWTTEWEGAETVWNYGITKDGNAVLNMLSVYKLTADYIDATDLHVSAANIDGKITADSIDVNSLLVNGDFEDEIVKIINGTVTAQYIEAKGVVANSLRVLDNNDNVLFSAMDNAVAIANFTVTNNSIENITPVTVTDGDVSVTYENGIKIMNDRIEILKECYAIRLQDGMINILTPELSGDKTRYYPLMSFAQAYINENGERIATSKPYYVYAAKTTDSFYVNPTWKIVIRGGDDSDDSESGGTIIEL